MKAKEQLLRALSDVGQRPEIVLVPLIVFAAAMLIGYLVRSLVLRGIRSWAERAKSRPGAIALDALRGPTFIWIFILAVHLAVESSGMNAHNVGLIARGLLALWIFSFTLMSMRAAGEMVRHFGGQTPGAAPVTTLTQNLAKLGILILGLLLMLNSLGAQVTPILTALGVGGLAVALALQDTLSNLFAGFYVSVSGQIRPGDYIKLNTGEEGYVADITWRCTAIRTLSNNLIIVPNAKLGQANVTNYHLPEKRMSASVQVSVAFDADEERVERALLEVGMRAAGEVPGMVADPSPSVTLDFGDAGLTFTLSYQVEEFARQTNVRHELRKRILRRMADEGISLALPTRTVKIEGPGPAQSA
jgi:small-conductance mechanosensitive channel